MTSVSKSLRLEWCISSLARDHQFGQDSEPPLYQAVKHRTRRRTLNQTSRLKTQWSSK
jgi:hypothetical protein